jgi:hypothetical protein
MNLINQTKIIEQIFNDIDKAIAESIRDTPVPFKDSNFYKKYNEIKKRYMR